MMDLEKIKISKIDSNEAGRFTCKEGATTSLLPSTTIGAFYKGQLIAVIAASYLKMVRKAEIELFCVLEEFRGLGIGKLLIENVEKELREAGAKTILLLYASDLTKRASLEYLLKRLDWKGSSPLLQRYYYRVQEFSPPWFKKRALPISFQIHCWDELKREERRLLQIQVNQGVYPYAVYPYGERGDPDSTNSLFLRSKDRVVGWIATHRVDSNTLIYSCLYVHRDYRNRQITLPLLCESIRKQQSSAIALAMFEINRLQVTSSWNRFISTHLASYSFQQTTIFCAQKRLYE